MRDFPTTKQKSSEFFLYFLFLFFFKPHIFWGLLDVLQSWCIFSWGALALEEFIFRWHNELYGIWAHGGPGLSWLSPSLFSVNVRWSLEALKTQMFCLNVSSSIYWHVSGSHPQMGSEVNDCFWYGNGAVSWSCNDAWQPRQRISLSCSMVLLGTAAWGPPGQCAEVALRDTLSWPRLTSLLTLLLVSLPRLVFTIARQGCLQYLAQGW